MNQKPDYNNVPYITVQLSPGCSEETLNAVIEFLRRNGVSHVSPSVNMRVCLRSAINPFAIVDEIRKVDAGADLFMFSKEEPPANSHRKSSPKNHNRTNGYKEEKRGMGDDQNGRSYHNSCKTQMPNAKEDEDFEDVKDPNRRHPNDCNEHKRNAKRGEGFASDQHYSGKDHKGKGHYSYPREEYVCRNDREDGNQHRPNGAFSRSQSCRHDGRNSQQPPAQPHYPGYSSRDLNGKGYHNHHTEEYVCQNYKEERNQQAPPKEAHIPSGAFSRENSRSQSCRWEGRNSQQPPPQPHYPEYTQKTRYDSPSDSHYARNSHYPPQAEPHSARNSHHQNNEFGEPVFSAPQAQPHSARNSHHQNNEFDAPQAQPHYSQQRPASYHEEHHNHHSNMAQPSNDYDHPHQSHQPYGYGHRGNWDMPYRSDYYHMGEDPHGCNIL